MKALMYVGERKLEVQDIPAPAGEFLVRVAGCAICGTDLKTYLHGHPFFKPPSILGHEYYGTVEKAPASTLYKPGDPVVVAPYGECGTCDMCRRGAGELCKNKGYVTTGGFCELIEVPLDFVQRGVIRLEKPDDAFALVEPLSCVLLALEKLHVTAASRVLIVGGGPMGTLFALTLLDRNVPVDVVEPNPVRADCLKKWGIPVLAPGEASYKNYDNVAVAVNKPELVEAAVREIADNGTVHVFAGMPSGTALSLDAYALHYRGVTVTGSSGFSLRQFRQAYGIIKANPDHYRRLITHRFPFEQGETAFDTLKAGDAFKILLQP